MFKYFIGVLALVCGQSLFASSSARIDATSELLVRFENQTVYDVEDIALVPKLICYTTVAEFGGESRTSVESAVVDFSSVAGGLESPLVSVLFQILKPATAQSPNESAFRQQTGCQTGVSVSYKLKQQPSWDSVVGLIGAAQSTAKTVNFTKEFSKNLIQGNFVFKEVLGGTTFCSDTNSRCPFCVVSLYQQTTAGEVLIGKSYQMLKCSKPY